MAITEGETLPKKGFVGAKRGEMGRFRSEGADSGGRGVVDVESPEGFRHKAQMTERHTSEQDYDDAPYLGQPYDKTHPNRLRALAALYGVAAPEVATSRILELGCATGENIIPLAAHYPEADIVGIDFSARQIETAKERSTAAGLSNLRFEHLSITDIDGAFGEFDYIISHGIFSWTPEDVRRHAVKVSSQNLSANGLAYMSFNALPGWSSVKSLRDFMRYHGRDADTPEAKVAAAREAYDFLEATTKDSSAPAHQQWLSEINRLKTFSDSHLLHDHLEEDSNPFYFHEVMAVAQEFGLQHICDSDLALQKTPRLTEQQVTLLNGLPDSIARQQYLDILNNRRFRMAILCKATRQVQENLSGDGLRTLYFRLDKDIPENVARASLPLAAPMDISFQGGPIYHVPSSAVLALWFVLGQLRRDEATAEQIIQTVGSKLHQANALSPGQDANALAQELMPLLVQCLFDGVISPMAEKPAKRGHPDHPTPEVMSYARQQVMEFGWFTNCYHQQVTPPPAMAALIKKMDGTRTKSQLYQVLYDYRKAQGHLDRFIAQSTLPPAEARRQYEAQTERDTAAFYADCLRACGMQGILT